MSRAERFARAGSFLQSAEEMLVIRFPQAGDPPNIIRFVTLDQRFQFPVEMPDFPVDEIVDSIWGAAFDALDGVLCEILDYRNLQEYFDQARSSRLRDLSRIVVDALEPWLAHVYTPSGFQGWETTADWEPEDGIL